MQEKCNHNWAEYRSCCYCGAHLNSKGEVIERVPQSNVESLRQEFSDWYFGIKEQTGNPPLAMQIFFWFDKNIGLFNALCAKDKMLNSTQNPETSVATDDAQRTEP